MHTQRMNVLVVDDEPVTRTAVAQTLEEAGYRVTVASNGQDALASLKQGSTQLVVSDWSMPGMTGLELCRAIRSTIIQRYVYIVMLTSHKRAEDAMCGLQAGADDYVTKPFHPGELILRVNTGRRIIRSESSSMTIFALAKLAEMRDQETGTHLERVQAYCHLLATTLRQEPRFQDETDDNFIRLIYETSPLHDIGKVAIPDAILLKPGRLSADEFEVMKTHATHGAATLAAAIREFPNAEFLRMAHSIALCHHERFDGSGYPHGLSGDDIPLCARIVALADVYDALMSKRVYKSAMSHPEVRSIIEAESGHHFDPMIVDAFRKVERGFLAIHRGCTDGSTELSHSAVPDRNAGFSISSPLQIPRQLQPAETRLQVTVSSVGDSHVCAKI